MPTATRTTPLQAGRRSPEREAGERSTAPRSGDWWHFRSPSAHSVLAILRIVVVFLLGLLDGEGGAAPARVLSIWIVQHDEGSSNQLLRKVHSRAADKVQRHPIDDYTRILARKDIVLRADLAIAHGKDVLEARASTALHGQSQVALRSAAPVAVQRADPLE